MTGPHETCHHKIYGLSCDDFELLLARAAGRCELCRLPVEQTPRGLLCIDHDPMYGWNTVRGLVCDKCNSHLAQIDARKRHRGHAPKAYAYYENAWFLRRLRVGAVSIPRTADGDQATDPGPSPM